MLNWSEILEVFRIEVILKVLISESIAVLAEYKGFMSGVPTGTIPNFLLISDINLNFV